MRQSSSPQLFATPYSLIKAEAVGLQPTTSFEPAPVFETGPSSGRMTSGKLIDDQHVMLLQAPTACGGAAVAGIEPAPRRLTAVGPYQHRPHRNEFFSTCSVSKPGRAYSCAIACLIDRHAAEGFKTNERRAPSGN